MKENSYAHQNAGEHNFSEAFSASRRSLESVVDTFSKIAEQKGNNISLDDVVDFFDTKLSKNSFVESDEPAVYYALEMLNEIKSDIAEGKVPDSNRLAVNFGRPQFKGTLKGLDLKTIVGRAVVQDVLRTGLEDVPTLEALVDVVENTQALSLAVKGPSLEADVKNLNTIAQAAKTHKNILKSSIQKLSPAIRSVVEKLSNDMIVDDLAK